MSYEVTIGDYNTCGYCEDCKIIDRAYQQGRADVIEEYNKRLKEHWIEEEDLGLSDAFFEYVDKIAEQLKSQDSK